MTLVRFVCTIGLLITLRHIICRPCKNFKEDFRVGLIITCIILQRRFMSVMVNDLTRDIYLLFRWIIEGMREREGEEPCPLFSCG